MPNEDEWEQIKEHVCHPEVKWVRKPGQNPTRLNTTDLRPTQKA